MATTSLKRKRSGSLDEAPGVRVLAPPTSFGEQTAVPAASSSAQKPGSTEAIPIGHFSDTAKALPPPDKKSQETFLVKLFAFLEGSEHHQIIRWDARGERIFVAQPKKLETDVLNSVFRQTKLTSFYRQLNVYGFSRKPNSDPEIRDSDATVWSHPTLTRSSSKEDVGNSKRKATTRKPKEKATKDKVDGEEDDEEVDELESPSTTTPSKPKATKEKGKASVAAKRSRSSKSRNARKSPISSAGTATPMDIDIAALTGSVAAAAASISSPAPIQTIPPATTTITSAATHSASTHGAPQQCARCHAVAPILTWRAAPNGGLFCGVCGQYYIPWPLPPNPDARLNGAGAGVSAPPAANSSASVPVSVPAQLPLPTQPATPTSPALSPTSPALASSSPFAPPLPASTSAESTPASHSHGIPALPPTGECAKCGATETPRWWLGQRYAWAASEVFCNDCATGAIAGGQPETSSASESASARAVSQETSHVPSPTPAPAPVTLPLPSGPAFSGSGRRKRPSEGLSESGVNGFTTPLVNPATSASSDSNGKSSDEVLLNGKGKARNNGEENAINPTPASSTDVVMSTVSPPASMSASGGVSASTSTPTSAASISGPTTSCVNCAATCATAWWKGPSGETYCSPCGLYQMQHGKQRPTDGATSPTSATTTTTTPKTETAISVSATDPSCSMCGTKQTPVWWKMPDGKQYCNPCRRYYKAEGGTPVVAQEPGEKSLTAGVEALQLAEGKGTTPASVSASASATQRAPTTDNLSAKSMVEPQKALRTQCANCGAKNTTRWWKEPNGENEYCNACWVYYKVIGEMRPMVGWPRARETAPAASPPTATSEVAFKAPSGAGKTANDVSRDTSISDTSVARFSGSLRTPSSSTIVASLASSSSATTPEISTQSRDSKCANCGATDMPLSPGKAGQRYCNRCELYLIAYGKTGTHGVLTGPKNTPSAVPRTESAAPGTETPTPECTNCGGSDVQLLLPNAYGERYCTPCVMYAYLHGKQREVDIKPRLSLPVKPMLVKEESAAAPASPPPPTTYECPFAGCGMRFKLLGTLRQHQMLLRH